MQNDNNDQEENKNKFIKKIPKNAKMKNAFRILK